MNYYKTDVLQETVNANCNDIFNIYTDTFTNNRKIMYKLGVVDPSAVRIPKDGNIPNGYTINSVFVYKWANKEQDKKYQYRIPLPMGTELKSIENKDLYEILSKNDFILCKGTSTIVERDATLKRSDCPIDAIPLLDKMPIFLSKDVRASSMKGKTTRIMVNNKINPPALCYINHTDINKLPNGFTNTTTQWYDKVTGDKFFISASKEEAMKFIPDTFVYGASPTYAPRKKKKARINMKEEKKQVSNKKEYLEFIGYLIHNDQTSVSYFDKEKNEYRLPLDKSFWEQYRVRNNIKETILDKLMTELKNTQDKKKFAKELISHAEEIKALSLNSYKNAFIADSSSYNKDTLIKSEYTKKGIKDALANKEDIYRCPFANELYYYSELSNYVKSTLWRRAYEYI